MSSSLASYLAKNYLTADEPAKKKKKKRKHESSSGLTIIADDDFSRPITNTNSDDDDRPTTVGNITRGFKKTTTSNWITAAADTAAADAIVASNTDGQIPEDTGEDAPAIASIADEHQKMSSGAHAGLQTADQMTAQLTAAARKEAAAYAAADPRTLGKGQDTIYRDASGRIINIAMARADARAAAAAEEAKERAIKDAQQGGVQKAAREQRRKELDEAKFMPMARYKDDKDMNEELKEKELWNDPAAAFLTKKKSGGRGYQGASEPNRYGIRPGVKWDGVDRGNGFEKKWFLAQNKKQEIKDLKYTSLVDID